MDTTPHHQEHDLPSPARDLPSPAPVATPAAPRRWRRMLLDVHFITSLPVMQQHACMVWADTRPVQSVWAVRLTKPDHDVVDDAFG